MTSADKRRVRKAIEGLQYPASKQDVVAYAEERGSAGRTSDALRALPDGTYHNAEEVAESVPQEPEKP